MLAVFSNINYWGLSSWERALGTIPDNDFESVDSNAVHPLTGLTNPHY
jgi:hypothetical protein